MQKAIFIFLVIAACISCESGKKPLQNPAALQTPMVATPAPTQPNEARPRIFFVILENTGFNRVIGNPKMPFINELAKTHALATNYFGNTHPSIGNYFMLATGKVLTNDTFFSKTVTSNNLARQINEAGKSWGVYAESLPSEGYLGDNAYPYVRRHNPFAYVSDVRNDPQMAKRIVPYEKDKFAALLQNGTLPDFVYLLPNQFSNAHDARSPGVDKRAYADKWLSKHLAPILNSADFQKNGLLVLTFDEAEEAGPTPDARHGGGHIVTLFIGPRAKHGYQSATFYQHESLLRLICDELVLKDCPGKAAGATSMREFLN